MAVVIPALDASRSANLAHLLEDLKSQTLLPVEIEVVQGVQPNGKARNVGVDRTTAEYLVFLDDDVRLGSTDVIEKFVSHLAQIERLGLVGTSQLLPLDSSSFQRQCANQLSRSQSAVVDVLTDSDMVTTQCCAIRRSVLEEVGRFHDRILRGVDPELRLRVRQAGYRIAVAPQAWHYHPMPRSLKALLRMALRDGAASAFARKHFPETIVYNPEGHVAEFEAQPPRWKRIMRKLLGVLRDLASGRWIGVLYQAAYTLGYLRGGK